VESPNATPTGPQGTGGEETPSTLWERVKRLLIGPPRDLADRSIYHRLSLIPFLAWVGLGADGLSSSAYGPEEAFRTLREHTYLAVLLAALMGTTVLVISKAYSRIIEAFPHGGGGYLVATKLLGARAGVVSGSALLVDYVLTIAISIAAAGDAIFSMLPMELHGMKMPIEVGLIGILIVLNLRGVRESVIALAPVFLLFLVTHAILIGGGLLATFSRWDDALVEVGSGFSGGYSAIGLGGMLLLFVHAYSLGGGTYTGIEAVSNGIAIMREPKVETAKRTMVYMGISLAITASGLLLCYLLWSVRPVEGKTMNAVFVERFIETVPLGTAFVMLTLLSEGALLVVAAQAGFVDGPRVLSNMAIDSWVPRRFGALSDRLTTQNGILLMGVASLGALVYTRGDVRHLVVMYSINVFVTFSLSMLGMVRHTWKADTGSTGRHLALFVTGLVFCLTILMITVWEKFSQGGWVTLVVTGGVVILCFLIRRHYATVSLKLMQLYRELSDVPRLTSEKGAEPSPSDPVAAVLVSAYSGLGLHTLLSTQRGFPGHFKGIVFVSVGVIDSREFKGEETVAALRSNVKEHLAKYVDFAHGQRIPACHRFAIGTDAVEVAEDLCLQVATEFPRVTFFAGRVLFERERWYQNILHNETAFAVQRRLQWAGKTVVVVPARVT